VSWGARESANRYAARCVAEAAAFHMAEAMGLIYYGPDGAPVMIGTKANPLSVRRST
jgi:hypothetical protein